MDINIKMQPSRIEYKRAAVIPFYPVVAANNHDPLRQEQGSQDKNLGALAG